MYSLTGKLIVKNDTEQVTERFKKREFVLSDEGGQYTEEILLQLTQDRCDMLDAYEVGDVLKVNFNLRGRRWKSPSGETKFFNSLDAWRIEKDEAAAKPLSNDLPPMPTSADPGLEDDGDDLPF